MKSNIFIPKKCKVGFNKRSDTYTGKLGYVIYHDGKKWRKETSWLNWIETYVSDEEYNEQKQKAYDNEVQRLFDYAQRNSGKVDTWWGNCRRQIRASITTIEEAKHEIGSFDKYEYYMRRSSNDPGIKPVEFDNVPLEGFVLNKKAGGTKYDWNQRQTYCRVYDPRGFEIELSIPNLLYILENTNSIKGKGLEGKFVYGWDGKDLVLIPEEAPEYQELVEFSRMQALNIKKSELILGGTYIDSDNNKVTYLGDGFKKNWSGAISATKALWFSRRNDAYFDTKDIKSIKKYTGENNPNFAYLIDQLEKKKEFIKTKPVYEKIENPIEHLEKNLTVHGNNYACYIKDIKTKTESFKPITIQVYNSYRYYNSGIEYRVYGMRRSETYSTIKELTQKYDLWQLKTTK